MVALDESGASGDALMGVFLMFSLFVGGGLPVVNPPYYLLVEFVIGLSCFIIVWVLVVMVYQVLFHHSVSMVDNENNIVEFAWTFIPSIIVLLFSFLNVSCFIPDYGSSGYNVVRVVGRQWYWSYGLPGSSEPLYDSVMGDLIDGVDKPLRLSCGIPHCLYVTSADVIHSFSVPFLSVKVDAIPGRINQFSFIPDYCGRHVGYCTELCGAGHAYMPVVVEVVPSGAFTF